MEKKIELILDMKTKKLVSELETAKAHIEGMNAEINVLKAQVQRLNSAAVEIPTRKAFDDAPHIEPVQQVQAQPQQIAPQQPKVTLSGQPAQKKEGMYNQRMGDLKPGDINLDNMFYFGNKR